MTKAVTALKKHSKENLQVPAGCFAVAQPDPGSQLI